MPVSEGGGTYYIGGTGFSYGKGGENVLCGMKMH